MCIYSKRERVCVALRALVCIVRACKPGRVQQYRRTIPILARMVSVIRGNDSVFRNDCPANK